MKTILRQVAADGSIRFDNDLYRVPERFSDAFGQTVAVLPTVTGDRLVLYSKEAQQFLGHADKEYDPCGSFSTYRVYRRGRFYMFLAEGSDEAQEFDDIMDCKRHVRLHLATLNFEDDETTYE